MHLSHVASKTNTPRVSAEAAGWPYHACQEGGCALCDATVRLVTTAKWRSAFTREGSQVQSFQTTMLS